MKIVQLIYSLTSGGAERFVVDLSNELATFGHEVHLVVFRNSEEENDPVHFYKHLIAEQVHYHNLNIKEGFRLSAFTTTITFIQKLKPDIVHCHLNVIPYIFPLALRRKGIKFLHTLHSIAPKTVGFSFQKKINRFFYRTNRILPITISDICLISYKDFYGLDNAAMIENGRSEVIPTQQFHVVKKEILSYKANKNTPVFIHLGKFRKEKNHQLLIDTFNRVDKKGADFLLLIIGADFDSDEGKQLQKGACDKIKFLGTKQNVNDYLLNANAFCLSSIYEGLPISLLEALSAGCVPICTPAGGIPNVITHGVTGILSDDFSDSAYYNAVMSYINSSVIIDREVLIQYFKENYSINKSAILHHELYSQ